jgi:hypothetical protein
MMIQVNQKIIKNIFIKVKFHQIARESQTKLLKNLVHKITLIDIMILRSLSQNVNLSNRRIKSKIKLKKLKIIFLSLT